VSEILDVLIVGAGLSGIGAACRLQRRCPAKRYAIVEARASIGGTWDLFRYPGVRSDSDMYTLGYDFRPWNDAKAIGAGPDILRYIRDTAAEGGIIPHIHFGTRVCRAEWSTRDACWTIEAERAPGGERERFRARFLFMCCGYYSYAEGYRPTFTGEAKYRGRVLQPQFWPKDLDYAGKHVIVIGSGATAVTLVPEMAKDAAHVTMLQRSPSYVVTRPSIDALAQWLSRRLPERAAYALTRWRNVLLNMLLYQLARSRPEQMKKRLIEMAREQVGPDFDVDTHFTPRYKPWDQRMCLVPDGDLFRRIREGRVSVVTADIECFTERGVKITSGDELPADIVVVATGLKLNVLGDVAIRIDGRPCDPGKAIAYKGMMLSDVPNLAMTFGYTNASWTLKADLTSAYVCRLLRYMDRRGFAIATPRRDTSVVPQPFLTFTSGYVQRALAILPKQGSKRPWKVYQNYLRDLLNLRYGRIADGVMHFSGGAKP
jgi:monooxygenase